MESYGSAAIVLCAGALSWHLGAGTHALVRGLIRGAAVLCALLALSVCIPKLPDLSLFLQTLALTSLVLAVYISFRRPVSSLWLLTLLTITFCVSLCGEFLGQPGLILIIQLPAALTGLWIARKGCMRGSAPSILLAISMAAEFCALSAALSPLRLAPNGVLLFSAAGLLGTSLAVSRISDTYIPDLRDQRMS